MESKGSLPQLQVPATHPYSEPYQSIPCPHSTYWRSILILSSHLCLGLPSGLFPSGSPSKPCIHISSSPYVLLAPPISFFSIWSPEQYLVSSTDHSAVQIIQQYRSFSCTDHSAVQIIQKYRSFSSTDHSAVQIIQQYRSFSSTDHSAVQIIQQYRSFSSTDHSAVQIIQQYRPFSSTDH